MYTHMHTMHRRQSENKTELGGVTGVGGVGLGEEVGFQAGLNMGSEGESLTVWERDFLNYYCILKQMQCLMGSQ